MNLGQFKEAFSPCVFVFFWTHSGACGSAKASILMWNGLL